MAAGFPPVPSLQATLSHVAPDKAAEIRSAILGALKYHDNGMYSFQESVETTFVLPWDLNPKVEPQKLTKDIRDGVRQQLMDSQTLHHLEGCGSINYSSLVLWQFRSVSGGEWSYLEGALKDNIEAGYCSPHMEWQFVIYPHQFQANFSFHKLMNQSTGEVYEVRRLAFSPTMPLKTELDSGSLFHASSLGFWGVHDRMSLLSQAVMNTLSDPKAQVRLFDRWSDEVMATSGEKPQLSQWEAAKHNIIGCPSLHIFTLSNVVQRPIIVYAHPESSVGGIYLPYLWEGTGGMFPCDSHPHLRNPLVLGYDCSRNHFVPLVTFKGTKGPDPIILPLHYASGKSLPIHFSKDSECTDPVKTLSKLLYVDYVSNSFQPNPMKYSTTPTNSLETSSSSQQLLFGKPASPLNPGVLVCVLNILSLPDVMDQLIKRYQSLFL